MTEMLNRPSQVHNHAVTREHIQYDQKRADELLLLVDNPPLDIDSVVSLHADYIDLRNDESTAGKPNEEVLATILREQLPYVNGESEVQRQEILRAREYALLLLGKDDDEFEEWIDAIYGLNTDSDNKSDIGAMVEQFRADLRPDPAGLTKEEVGAIYDDFWGNGRWKAFHRDAHIGNARRAKMLEELIPEHLASKGLVAPNDPNFVGTDEERAEMNAKWKAAERILEMNPKGFEAYVEAVFDGGVKTSSLSPNTDPQSASVAEPAAALSPDAMPSSVDNAKSTPDADSTPAATPTSTNTDPQPADADISRFDAFFQSAGAAPALPDTAPASSQSVGAGSTAGLPNFNAFFQAPNTSSIPRYDAFFQSSNASTPRFDAFFQTQNTPNTAPTPNTIDTSVIDARITGLEDHLEILRARLTVLSAKRQGRLYVGKALREAYEQANETYETQLAELNIAKAERQRQLTPETSMAEFRKLMIETTLTDDVEFREQSVEKLQSTKFSKFVNFLTTGSKGKRFAKQALIGVPVTGLIALTGPLLPGVVIAGGATLGLKAGMAGVKRFINKDAQSGRGFTTEVNTDARKAELHRVIDSLQFSDGKVTQDQLRRMGKAVTSRVMTAREKDTANETKKRRRSALAGLGGAALGAVAGSTVAHFLTSGPTLGETMDNRSAIPYDATPTVPEVPAPAMPAPAPELVFSPDAVTIEAGEGIRQTIMEATGTQNITGAQFDAIVRDVAGSMPERTYAMGADSWGWNAPGQLSQVELQSIVDSAKAHGVMVG